MQPNNRINQPLIIISITLSILLIMSFIKFDYLVESANFNIHNVDLLSDIKEESVEEPMNNIIEQRAKQINYASFGFSELPSDILRIFELGESGTASDVLVQGRNTPITGNTKQLSYFFEALKNVKSKSVRIAHYGDSAIEGDLVTSDLRENLQSRFNGNGVGWLGIISQDIAFRTTTKHSFSNGNWEAASVYTSNPKGLPLGISCEANIPKGNAWVQYQTTTAKRYLKDFTVAKLYYSNAKNSQIKYSFDGGAAQAAQLSATSGLQELILKPAGRAKTIKIEFPTPDQATVYGISLENEPGIYIDNLPLRGNSGVDLQQINTVLMKDFAKYLDYKLIVLEFGLNIAGARADYTWYEREMLKVINNLKTAFPRTSIVMISVHDKAMKKGSSFVTDPAIIRLLQTQKDIAQKAGVAIWSLFDAMGGENSMPDWVNANPPMAFKDYIHFNDQGAKKVARLFSDALLDEFNKYK